jgi:phosphatidylglycerol:prolipoprotein diacylglycerol transferase
LSDSRCFTPFPKKNRKYDGQLILLYLAWYGLGRFWIEGLRTDSLYLFGSNIRVSQLVAALTVAVAVYILIRRKLRGNFTPEDLFVNRKRNSPLSETARETAEDQEQDNEHKIDKADDTEKEKAAEQ